MPQPPAYRPDQAAHPDPRWSTAGIAGGIAAAVLLLVGAGVGIYLAASKGTAVQARLVAPAGSAGGSGAPGQALKSGNSPALPPSVAATPSTPAPISASQAVANTIERHFTLIGEHRFSAAYALLAPNLQSGESTWIQSHREDGIYKVSVHVAPAITSSASATATIMNMTTLDGHGCKRWSGGWGLTRLGGQWRISQANVSFGAC
jgi:hypothetical protein